MTTSPTAPGSIASRDRNSPSQVKADRAILSVDHATWEATLTFEERLALAEAVALGLCDGSSFPVFRPDEASFDYLAYGGGNTGSVMGFVVDQITAACRRLGLAQSQTSLLLDRMRMEVYTGNRDEALATMLRWVDLPEDDD